MKFRRHALPPDFRMVLMPVDVQELNYQEVAQVLDIPIGTVKSRLARPPDDAHHAARLRPAAGAGRIADSAE